MGEDRRDKLSTIQKDVIYIEALAPLRAKISQMLLYDTKAALHFLQVYNEIIENEEQSFDDIVHASGELQSEIDKYEKTEGKEKIFDEKCKALLQAINDLKINSIHLSLKEFENKFGQLEDSYLDDISDLSLKNRAVVDSEFYALQASLIMRQVAAGKRLDKCLCDIGKRKKEGLKNFINCQANVFLQREDLKDIANEIKNIAISDGDAVLNPRLWSLMNAAENGRNLESQLQVAQQTTSTAMMIAPKNKSNTLKERILRLFNKEPAFPLQVSDLKKISLEWLSKYIPRSMLERSERSRLRQEIRNGKRIQLETSEIYIPNPKIVIFAMIAQQKRKNDNFYNRTYELFEVNGGTIEIEVHGSPFGHYLRMRTGEFQLDGESRDKKGEFIRPNEALGYAEWLDGIFGTNFEQQLLHELREVYIERKHTKDPIRRNLLRSLDNMSKEYKRVEVELKVTEETNREKFYKDLEDRKSRTEEFCPKCEPYREPIRFTETGGVVVNARNEEEGHDVRLEQGGR